MQAAAGNRNSGMNVSSVASNHHDSGQQFTPVAGFSPIIRLQIRRFRRRGQRWRSAALLSRYRYRYRYRYWGRIHRQA